MKIEKAQESFGTVKIGLRGPSGSGKTLSSLLIAYGLCKDWEKILVIDTERSAGVYKRLGNFSKISLSQPYSTQRFIEAFRKGVEADFKVIIFDSISHWWSGVGGVLETNSLIEENFCKGNSFKAWLKTNKEYYLPLIHETILQDAVHVIFTMRTKTKYVVQTDSQNGKSRIQKMGMKEDMREGFDYELSIVFDLDQFHIARASKDRSSIFDGDSFIITPNCGVIILNWINTLPSDSAKTEPKTEPKTEVKTDPKAGGLPKAEYAENYAINKMIARLEYYLPVLARYNNKLYHRALEVIQEKNPENIKKALTFIDANKQDLEKVVIDMIREYLESVSRCEDEEQKANIIRSAPQILKQHESFTLIK